METEIIKLRVTSDKIIAWLRTNIPSRLKSRTTSTSWQHRHSFSVFIVEQPLHLHKTLRSQSFLSNISLSFITTILVESFIIGILLSGSNWKPIALFSKSIFTLITKNVRNLVVENNEYTRDENFLEGLWRKFFSTRLISCAIILASLVYFPCFNSVSYDSHCLILCKQTSNIIIIKILTAITQYIFIQKNFRGFFLTLDIFFGLIDVHVTSCA